MSWKYYLNLNYLWKSAPSLKSCSFACCPCIKGLKFGRKTALTPGRNAMSKKSCPKSGWRSEEKKGKCKYLLMFGSKNIPKCISLSMIHCGLIGLGQDFTCNCSYYLLLEPTMGTDTRNNNQRELFLPVFSLDTYFNSYHAIQICPKKLNQSNSLRPVSFYKSLIFPASQRTSYLIICWWEQSFK